MCAAGTPEPVENRPWLRWAMQLQTIAEAGLQFSSDPFDLERYENVRRIAAELIASHLVDGDLTTVETLFPVGHGYPTPKVDVRALVLDGEGRLLCVRNVGSRRWSLPGGFADLGESPMETARREVREETGYDVRPTCRTWTRDHRGGSSRSRSPPSPTNPPTATD